MVAASEHQDAQQLSSLFESLVPGLVAQMKADAKRPDLKNLWGRSINFDEGAKGQILHPAILQTIGQAIEIPVHENAGHLVHAGMEHTYGYLFSNLKTPFGFKRARWVQGEIERGFNLPAGVLGPNTNEGTLLLNITSFIGKIAFRSEAIEREVIHRTSRDAARAIRNFRFEQLEPSRLLERVEVPNENGKTRTVKIYTDLVPFLRKPGNPKANSHLLIYTVVDPFSHNAQLITAFPVQADFARRVLDPKGVGEARISTRYNGYVDGLTGKSLPGVRRLIQRKATDRSALLDDEAL
ncbi:MAG: hypothetical protein A2X94_16475 [Bdellovibrionales bacterium GWB1_55_8]|nr:MAG: hypothetical protein A2X94_16475 [Bdellovibrionales bacterium GWB1_55_8]